MQLSLLDPAALRPAARPVDPRRLRGAWAAGERWLRLGGWEVEAAVWFRFAPGGRAAVSVRWDEDGRRATIQARWSLAGRDLAVALPRGTIRGPARLAGDVLHWAGETLPRVPAAGDPEIALAATDLTAPGAA